jgi:hypothetical protein
VIVGEIREALVDELDYALRPPRHERRVPSYGAFVLPRSPVAAWGESTGLDIVSNATTELDDDEVRRYADGLTSWTIRGEAGVDALVVFDRAAGSERDLVVLAEASGATLVQRHPTGDVRLVGAFGVARWDGSSWHIERPVEAWLEWASCGGTDRTDGALHRLLQFAVHDLGAQRIGALLVYRPTPNADAFELRLRPPPRLHIDRPADLAPLRHVLTQVDGAALFDEIGSLTALGVRLIPSRAAEAAVGPVGGTRHTSARRYSYDDRGAVVIAVSDDGPVTVYRRGEVVGTSPT